MSKTSTKTQRIIALENEMRELKELMRFLVGSDSIQVKLKIDPKEDTRWLQQLRATESEYTLKAS